MMTAERIGRGASKTAFPRRTVGNERACGLFSRARPLESRLEPVLDWRGGYDGAVILYVKSAENSDSRALRAGIITDRLKPGLQRTDSRQIGHEFNSICIKVPETTTSECRSVSPPTRISAPYCGVAGGQTHDEEQRETLD